MTFSIATAKRAFGAAIFSLFFFSCNYHSTRTESKKPEFAKEPTTISGELRALINCENINMRGSKMVINEKITSCGLTIELINPTNTNEDLNELGKKIAAQLKQDLKDPNEFDIYEIDFVKKTQYTTYTRNFIYTKDKL